MHVRFQGGVTGRCRTFHYFVATPRIELEIKPYESSVIPFHHVAILERVTGIEPASPAWKARVLTVIRYSHFEQESRIELPSSAWQADVIATIRLLHLRSIRELNPLHHD